MAETRPTRICDLCGGYDQDPRHAGQSSSREAAAPSDAAVVRALEAIPSDHPVVDQISERWESLSKMTSTPAQMVSAGELILDGVDRTITEPESVSALIDLFDTGSFIRHMDCCAHAGCPSGDCSSILAAAGGNKEKLLKHLTTAAKGN